MKDPTYYSDDKIYRHEHRNDFFTPENLIITIKTKVKHYSFGGPVYSAVVNLYKEEVRITFVPPRYKGAQQYEIKWDKILEVDFHFFPKVSRIK
ncbi:hypothetical protein KKF32_03835 [Patescibacteria group bacterium]|nr:hypothetical protein [Patescibacteria group bacterium]